MIDPACRRCHSAPEAAIARARSERKRFVHGKHPQSGEPAACAGCHRIDQAGGLARSGPDHASCAGADCHTDDFGSRQPETCGACHIGSEPWLELFAEVIPPPRTEFGSVFSHRGHLGGDKPRIAADCTTCHGRNTPARELRLPRDHAACSGNACHRRGGGAAPALDACTDCHVADLVSRRDRDRRAARWSVRSKFRHEPHRREPRDEAALVACTDCHRGAAEASSLADMPTPEKATCQRCHDGATAFKLTGHSCSRCHSPTRTAKGSR